MPRPRAAEMPQRPSPRGGPPNLRTSSSDSDSLHNRSRTDNSPKLSDGRSPRGSQSDPVHQRKLGSRISDLESQLGQAQDELKCLKNQLVSAEAAKKGAQQQLDKKSKKQPKKNVPEPVDIHKNQSTTIEIQESNKKDNSSEEYETPAHQETDVFEVMIENVTAEPKMELNSPADEDELKPRPVSLLTEVPPLFDELTLKNDELTVLKTKLGERDKELKLLRQENENMKSQLHDKSLKISSAECKIEELNLRLNKIDQELAKSKMSTFHTNEKLEACEIAKNELEKEMRRLRVQTEQWKKAADAAANILAGETEKNSRRISERCGSMDKHYGNAFEAGYVGSPGLMEDASDDGFGGGKRKGSGIRMFGDLWKKKGNK